MRWTRRWRRVWRAWQGRWRRPTQPAAAFPTQPAPARWRGWRRLLALYVLLGLLTGGMIAFVSTPGPALRSAAQRLGTWTLRAVAEVVPAARFLFATDQELARTIVRSSLPLPPPPGGPGRRGWLDRLVEGVTGLDPGSPESFLHQTMIARGGGRDQGGRMNQLEPEPEPMLDPSLRADGAAPGPPLPPTGPAERGPAVAVPPIPRRAEPELRRFPWGTAPLIGIYHTHSSETYHGPKGHTKGRSYSADDYAWGKTTGMISIGDELARVLTEDYRIPVVHSRNIHDYPVYRDAYTNSAVTVREMLRRYPTLRLLLDVHRDGLAEVDRDFITTVMGGERLARVLLIVGRGQPGLPNPHWEQNLVLAERLHAKMEEMYPGLSRGVTVRNWPYNQELSDRVLLLELGDHYNTKEEAMKSAVLLADCLAALLADQSAGAHQPGQEGGR
ncbi:MAG: stage II sporulation protein P [Bacillota bacterium]|nr:stage II sporulation protein P [Bacillota bacterium]